MCAVHVKPYGNGVLFLVKLKYKLDQTRDKLKRKDVVDRNGEKGEELQSEEKWELREMAMEEYFGREGKKG